MKAIAWSEFRRNPSSVISLARRKPVTLRFAAGDELVLMSRRELAGILETLHVLSDPRDGADLRCALEDVKIGRAVRVN